MMNQYWFVLSSGGYAAKPVTWEGYTLVAIFAVVVFACVLNAIRREKQISDVFFPPPVKVAMIAGIILVIAGALKTKGL